MPIPERLQQSLADHYRIEREIGQGGMATVYLAHDLKHDRAVALKVMRPELAAVIGADRFLAEIRTTANLQHPHIVPLHDSGTVDHPASPLAHAGAVTLGATTPRVLTQELHAAMSLPRLQLPTVALCDGESVDLVFVGALRALRHVRIFSTDAPGAAQALWPLLERALAASIGRRLFASIRAIENPLVAKAMTVALPLAGRCLPVKDVALALGIHERTLRKRLLRADAPSPQWLVGWARLIVAAWHLRDSARSASDVAAQLEFSASQNLCRMVRRYTGRSLRAFRAEDPVEVAARCIVDNGGRPT